MRGDWGQTHVKKSVMKIHPHGRKTAILPQERAPWELFPEADAGSARTREGAYPLDPWFFLTCVCSTPPLLPLDFRPHLS